MSLQPGTELNQYRIADKLGEGGMGQVYRAEDTRLRRDVAVKLLPPELLQDAERRARLEREAQVLASLNHPHVAAIYGLEEATDSDGAASSFLVMELVEGMSLADRIAEGPIPPERAIPIARGIALGLEAAHEKGIVHRDLKPANVMLDADSNAKVLDFGLAKAIEGEPGSAGLNDLSASPTIMGTQAGVILGTASYMAPEQARGKTVDKRADIWAFGCVLYEMLGGRKPFDGETATDIIAAIVRAEPDVNKLPAGTPPRLRELVRRCLVKDPRERLRDIGDARIELERAFDEPLGAVTAPSSATRASSSWLAAALVGGIALGATGALLTRPTPVRAPVRHALLGTEDVLPITLTVSPDGRYVVYSIGTAAWLRSMADGTDSPLEIRTNGPSMAFGPDGFLYFVEAATALRRMDVQARAPVTVAENGGSVWFSPVVASEGTVYIARSVSNGTPPIAIDSIDIATGRVTEVATWDSTEHFFIPTHAIPGGEALLGVSTTGIARAPQPDDLQVARLDLDNGSLTVIANGFGWPSLIDDRTMVMTDSEGRLVSVEVDPTTLEMVGVPRPRIEGLASLAFFTAYSVAADGSLFYVGGDTVQAEERMLYWVDRQGRPSEVSDKVSFYDSDSTISPDGRYLALERSDVQTVLIWVHDLQRDTQALVWPDETSSFPVWSPDSTQLAVRLVPADGPEGIFLMSVDRSAPPERVTSAEAGRFHLPMDWSATGTLVYVDSDNPFRAAGSDSNLWLVRPGSEAEPEPFLASDVFEVEARFSPDGRWLAYASDHSGTTEVYVRAADGSGGETPISTDGGTRPSWNPAGGELFYNSGRRMVVVEVETGDRFTAGIPQELFVLPEGHFANLVEPDRTGQRFLTIKPLAAGQVTQLRAVFNWTQTLEQ